MSILHIPKNGWILSHPKFFKNIEVVSVDQQLYQLDERLFEITDPFLIRNSPNHDYEPSTQSNDHTKIKEIPLDSTTADILKYFEQIIIEGKKLNIFRSDDCHTHKHIKTRKEFGRRIKNGNPTVKEATDNFYKNMTLDLGEMKLHGANATETGIISEINGHSFLFPKNTKFYSGDVKTVIETSLKQNLELFDLIIMDPPWNNKYIKRNRKRRLHERGGYDLLDDTDIGRIPMDSICADGALIAVWCTNAKSHQRNCIESLFKKWNVAYLTTWYWIKVTSHGEPICPFSSADSYRKQPYETIILGKYSSLPCPTSESSKLCSDSFPDLKTTKLVVSIPSGLHSHKPPLSEILLRYCPDEAKCCELFARYLIPGFTSIGNEVIKLQHLSLYTNNSD